MHVYEITRTTHTTPQQAAHGYADHARSTTVSTTTYTIPDKRRCIDGTDNRPGSWNILYPHVSNCFAVRNNSGGYSGSQPVRKE
jgi:hypothetical protein